MAWAHKILVPGSRNGGGQKNDVGLNVLLFDHNLQKTVFYRIWFNYTNRIQQALQLFLVILYLFRVSLSKWKWPACDVFQELFSKLISLAFFLIVVSLLLSMQNNKNNYKGAEREERKKNKTKKITSKRKKEFGKGLFIYDIRNIHKHPVLV